MADPLSITASVAGVITLVSSLTTTTRKIVQTYKNAPSHWSTLSTTLEELKSILEALSNLLTETNGETHTLSTLLLETIAGLQNDLKRLEEKLKKMQREGTKKDQLLWVFKKDGIEEVMTRIQRGKSTLSLGMDMVNLQMASGTQKVVHSNTVVIEKLQRTVTMESQRTRSQIHDDTMHLMRELRAHRKIMEYGQKQYFLQLRQDDECNAIAVAFGRAILSSFFFFEGN